MNLISLLAVCAVYGIVLLGERARPFQSVSCECEKCRVKNARIYLLCAAFVHKLKFTANVVGCDYVDRGAFDGGSTQ